jgi:hypothetical protein
VSAAFAQLAAAVPEIPCLRCVPCVRHFAKLILPHSRLSYRCTTL